MTLAQLDERAYQLYNEEASVEFWMVAFEPLQLAKLWHEFCVYRTDASGNLIEAAAYDDEVYEALAELGYFNYDRQGGTK